MKYEINNLGIAHSGDAPSLDDLTENFDHLYRFQGVLLQSVGVNESLQLGGTWN